MTCIYILLTFFLKKWLKDRKLTVWHKCLIGVIFGICSVLSTHFGADFNHMMVNVRDIGPLNAGFFFDPVSGIIAGLIGGIERYIAGTYFNVGAYTTIACSVSTVLAGFLAAFLHYFIFKRKMPSAAYAFFMGAFMEVFHMYAVFVTHQDDMDMAFYVVRNCTAPMIIFTALGTSISAFLLNFRRGQHRSFKDHFRQETRSVSQRFQTWLFFVTILVIGGSFAFTYLMQTNSSMQSSRSTLKTVSNYLIETYEDIENMNQDVNQLSETYALNSARAMADTIERLGGVEGIDQDYLVECREIFGLLAVAVTDGQGEPLYSSGRSSMYTMLFEDVLSGAADQQVLIPTEKRICAAVRITGGMVQVVLAKESVEKYLNQDDQSRTLSNFKLGNEGSFDIVRDSGYIGIGTHSVTILTGEDRTLFQQHMEGGFFESAMFGTPALCLIERINEKDSLLLRLPMTEVFSNRAIQAHENALANILLFVVIYVLVTMLVQNMVIENLLRVNKSLAKITGGDLNEVVSVRNSAEFASLSDDINQTVTALKGYIDAAEHRMEQELQLARDIQASALPRNFSFPRTDFEIFALMNPAKEVGGDFYDFFFVEHDRLALVIADVSGKGIPAALFMMQSKVAIRGLAEAGNSPAEICYKANNILCEGNDAEMFVTAWIGIIDLETGLMKCANAGHEYPALMRAGQDYELYKDKHGLVLAAMQNVKYQEYEIQLNPGDRLFVYTDGVPEAINTDTQAYGTDRMVEELNVLKEKPEEELLVEERQHIRDFVGEAEQFDDITMLGFCYYGPYADHNSTNK